MTIGLLLAKTTLSKIVKVYFVGKGINELYKIYIQDDHQNCLRINLNANLEDSFIEINNYKPFTGKLTTVLNLKDARKYFESYESNNIRQLEISRIVKELLTLSNWSSSRNNELKNPSFHIWLLSQINRDDLIGDIAYDIYRDKQIKSELTVEEIKQHVAINVNDIKSLDDFDENAKSVSPSVCVELALLEYKVFNNKKTLKRFSIRDTAGYVYFMHEKLRPKEVKIGRARNVERRARQLSTGRPYDLRIIGVIKADDYFALEKKVQEYFKEKKIRKEWFRIEGELVKKYLQENNGELYLP
ncbi:hypothetical protein CEQ90_19830 [Lewinellaceae bacterium SD302]|nr:hypothetical protein CEQ90_19830 [Lewinellaceae bacterium SD302]